MKGLIITVVIIILLILVGIGVSVLITDNLNHEMAVARALGYEEGYARGYQDGFEHGSKIGYQEGSKTGYIRAKGEESESSDDDGSYFIYNPTYAEVSEILVSSQAVSAEEILAYADSNSIRAAYIRVQLADEADASFPPLVAFETVDRGLIIVEPWSYRKVEVEVGSSYSELNGMPPRTYDDTITKISIVW